MGSGTITEFPNEICGGAAVATEPFTNNIGRDINFSGCNDAGGNLQFQEVDGGLDASASIGVVGDLSIFTILYRIGLLFRGQRFASLPDF